eukprot:TRINITY_DN464_c0_g1_i19.p1 TRINITY_DN464_c0_g1~~TRINITY_DN464_c0_g1_i19.p1  ORF type:complete len:103 (+),score=48.29 TRINITY_DN464_c0_g1_i19:63-371(+)
MQHLSQRSRRHPPVSRGEAVVSTQSTGVASRAVSAFELWGPSVVLYWRGMAPLATQAAAVAVAAVAPGEYVAPASSAYAYYAADDRHWVQPPRILIRPAAAT